MKILRNILVFSLVGLLSISSLLAQETSEHYNPNSIDPIPKYEQLFKKRVWLRIDLKEKQNKGFFAKNGELSKLILDAVKSGELDTIYKNDSLTTTMTKDEFLNALVSSEAEPIDPYDPDAEYYEGDQVMYNGVAYTSLYDENLGVAPEGAPDDWESDEQAGKDEIYFANQISVLRMMEDRIFDKRRSRLYYDIQAVQVIVPGSETTNSVDNPVGVFSYKDLEKVFRNHPKEAVWFNRYNTAQNKNFADAFTLRLFHGVLIKVENPDDLDIIDIYTTRKEGVMASEWLDLQLMEKEHNLWEY
jgi:gliding motility associated protien GldN